MDPVSASGLTIVSAVWTLSVRLRELIGNLKAQKENVRKLEHKAETLAVIIQQVEAACKPHEGKGIQFDEEEENVRRTVRSVTSRCRDDLEESVKDLSKLSEEKKTGRFRMDMVLRTWRLQVATPTFVRIEKSIEGHKFSLQLLLSVLHGRNLDATRMIMSEKLNAIHSSNQEMRTMLELLAFSPDRLSQHESTAEIDTATLRRRDTDVTLVDPQNGSANMDSHGFAEDDSRQLHQLFIRIFAVWLSQMNSADKRISEAPDLHFDFASPKEEASAVHVEYAEPESFNDKVMPNLADPMWTDTQKYRLPDDTNENGTKAMLDTRREHIERLRSPPEMPPPPPAGDHPQARPRRRSSPPIGPTDIPLSISPTPTRTSHISPTTSPSQSSQHESTNISSISHSEAPPPNETASRELLRAVTKKDIHWINMLIDSEMQPDLEYREREPSDKNKKSRGMTPLLLAVKLGEVETIKLLISKGANIEARDCSGMTPFILAASLDKVEIMRELIARGANMCARDKNERTALHVAIKDKARNSISFLLQLHSDTTLSFTQKPDINAGDKSERTPLHYCAEMDNLEYLAKMLIDQGAYLEASDVAKKTPAYYAIKHRKYFIVELLLKSRADLNQDSLDATSDEIRKLIKRHTQACNGSDVKREKEKERERSKSEVNQLSGRDRKGSWLSVKTSMFRRSSARH